MSVPCWTPKEHRYDGSCDSSQLVLPHYDTMPDYVRVYDTAVRTNGWRRWQKKLWRDIRSKALWRWFPDRNMENPPFVVTELKNRYAYPKQGITLTVQEFVPITVPNNNYGGFGLYPLVEPWTAEYSEIAWQNGKGFVAMHPKTVYTAFKARVPGYAAGAMCHEFGHALGFGHGGTGIMRSAIEPPYYPNTEDLLAFREYWGEP